MHIEQYKHVVNYSCTSEHLRHIQTVYIVVTTAVSMSMLMMLMNACHHPVRMGAPAITWRISTLVPVLLVLLDIIVKQVNLTKHLLTTLYSVVKINFFGASVVGYTCVATMIFDGHDQQALYLAYS